MSNSFDNFAALMNAVFTETIRPDLIMETAQAVFSSTLKMHSFEGNFFSKDIQPAQLIFDTTSYIQQIDTGTLPFYRGISYIRKDNPAVYSPYELNPTNLPPLYSSIDGQTVTMGVARRLLEEIDPTDFLDDFGVEKVDIWYQAGDSINIRSSTPLKFGLMGYYRWPNLDIQNFNEALWGTNPALCSPLFKSWVAKEYPYAIIYDAASAVLQKTGDADAARKYDAGNLAQPQGLVWAHVRNLVASNIVMTGR